MTRIGEIIKAFSIGIWSVVKFGAAALVMRVLGAFGLTLVTFNGVLPHLKNFLAGFINMLPPQALSFMGAIGIDVAMTMVLSALSVRLAWKVYIVPKGVADSIGAS